MICNDIEKILNNILLFSSKDCERMLPTQKQFKTIARDVKKLADTLLQGDATEEEVSDENNLETFRKNKENENTFENDAFKTENFIYEKHDKIIDHSTNSNESHFAQNITGIGPAATSTPKNLSLEDIKTENINLKHEPSSIEDIKENHLVNDITVGMAFMPEVYIKETMLPSCYEKKVITEVPSELRKLAIKPLECSGFEKTKQISTRTRRGKRFAKKRMTRGRISSFHLKINRMVSYLFNDQETPLFQDASELEINESEVLQRSISYGSFHSLKEEFMENVDFTAIIHKYDVCVDCDLKVETKDNATLTFIEKQDSSIQVNDEIAIELLMDVIPQNIRSFLEKLKNSSTNTKIRLNSSLFNMKIIQSWKTNMKFRQGLEILAEIFSCNTDNSNNEFLNSYEDFVNVMNCLDILEEMFKPQKILVFFLI